MNRMSCNCCRMTLVLVSVFKVNYFFKKKKLMSTSGSCKDV